jgi:hypothetical protein
MTHVSEQSTTFNPETCAGSESLNRISAPISGTSARVQLGCDEATFSDWCCNGEIEHAAGNHPRYHPHHFAAR